MKVEAKNSEEVIEPFVRAKKKKFDVEPKLTEDKKIEEVVFTGEDDITDLLISARKEIEGVFVADEESSLLEVSGWIPMKKPIQDVMGTPGLPCGLITMAQGKKDCGKTTFATEALISAQQCGGIAILLDTENKYSLKRASQMGLDIKKLIIVQAVTIEEAFDKFIAMINLIKNKTRLIHRDTGEVITKAQYDKLKSQEKKRIIEEQTYAHKKVVCVWDSLGATPSDAEMDETTKDFSMTAAKVIKGKMRKVIRYIRDTRVAFVIINQVYANMNTFGKKTTSYGGSGPEYHSAVILEFSKQGHIRPTGMKSGDGPFCGIKTEVECIKNHLAQPFKKVNLEIDFKGIIVDGRSPEYAPEEELKEVEHAHSTGASGDGDSDKLPVRKKAGKIGKSKA